MIRFVIVVVAVVVAVVVVTAVAAKTDHYSRYVRRRTPRGVLLFSKQETNKKNPKYFFPSRTPHCFRS